MSKSTGNVISPEEILKNSGADILRAWVASSDYSEDLRIDKTILSQHAESYRKIRNTFRFILGNIQDNFDKQDLSTLKIDDFEELERYILHKLHSIDQSIKENLNNYNFHKLYKELLNFCSLDLSSFYFDIRKDVLYCDNLKSKKRKECVIVLNLILECLLKWFAPIFVFTTEEIYSLVSKNEQSIHELTFYEIPQNWENKELDKKWKSLFKIKQEANIAIEEKRSSKEIGSSLEAQLEISINKKEFSLLEGLDLAEYFITSSVKKFVNKTDQDKTKMLVKKALGEKCPRCWKVLETTCERCEKILNN